MLYLFNLNKYIFVIEPSANVDVSYLKSKGCEFLDSLEQLYKVSADAQDLSIEEVEGCEFSVLFSKLHNEIVCVDQRGCGLEITEKLEDFISNFQY